MPKKEINLLPREEFERKPLGRFLTWALTAGRYIVIFVELIVLLAFLSRFKLDRDLSDLTDKIQAKQAQIDAYSEFESQFRSLQKRLVTIQKIQESQTQGDEIVLAIAQALPVDVSLEDLEFSEKGINLSGVALSDSGLRTFVANLSVSEKFTKISINNIIKKAGEGIVFSITFEVKKEEKSAG